MCSRGPLMTPAPLYTADNLRPAYELRYGWTGWLGTGGLPSAAFDAAIATAACAWETEP
jgi:hypothetical protein